MSKRHEVAKALRSLVEAALPDAEIYGFDGETSHDKRESVSGMVTGFQDEPGEPQVDLCPLTYHFEHAFALLVSAPTTAAVPGDALDAMLGAIGSAVAQDRNLGGLTAWLETTGASPFDETEHGTATVMSANVAIIAHYSTPDPLN